MGALWKRHPEDLDAGTLHEAMMDTQPWDYWQNDGVTPRARAWKCVHPGDRDQQGSPTIPARCISTSMPSKRRRRPERAEAAADRLEKLMPRRRKHVVHMPSHIYYRVGRYADAAHVNELAALVDEQYIAACKAQGYYPVGYYGHNIHFLWTSSEMEGRYAAAITAARRLVKAVDAVNAAQGPGGPNAEFYAFTPVATLLRFGKWDEVLKEPPPPAALRLSMAVWLEAQGFAHANTGDIAAAKADREKLAALAGAADFSRYNAAQIPAKALTDLSLATLDGEIARASGDLNDAIGRFRLAADIEKGLPYTEPPYWHQPTAHLLGARPPPGPSRRRGRGRLRREPEDLPHRRLGPHRPGPGARRRKQTRRGRRHPARHWRRHGRWPT